MAITSTLRVHSKNPRYFTDDSGKGIYLTGSHTWANLQDIGVPGRRPFPYTDYLDFLSSRGHNFMRLWMFEQPRCASWTRAATCFDPLPWLRTGPGLAADGLPRFDLDALNEAYFNRLRQRIQLAGERGIYCAVMLFQGWSLHKLDVDYGDPWPHHPFNGSNNINGIQVESGAADDDTHPCVHSLLNDAVLEKQAAYLAKVVDTVNDLDNVLYEIINEGGAVDWQYHMIDLVHEMEAKRPKQHPVGMTHRVKPLMSNAALFESNAEWISPASEPMDWLYPQTMLAGSKPLQDYQSDPPVADGRKVIISDTDHLWGHGGNPAWVWKTFLRGQHPIFMDPWWPLDPDSDPATMPGNFIGGVNKDDPDFPDWEPVRIAMGATRRFAELIDLAEMEPRPELASSGYCLANVDREYLIYLPEGGKLTLDLGSAPTGSTFSVDWYFPRLDQGVSGVSPLSGGDYVSIQTPFTGDAVLHLRRK